MVLYEGLSAPWIFEEAIRSVCRNMCLHILQYIYIYIYLHLAMTTSPIDFPLEWDSHAVVIGENVWQIMKQQCIIQSKRDCTSIYCGPDYLAQKFHSCSKATASSYTKRKYCLPLITINTVSHKIWELPHLSWQLSTQGHLCHYPFSCIPSQSWHGPGGPGSSIPWDQTKLG